MMYEVIVLGATFAAAGIAHSCKEKCLVIERRLQAGYEFFGALHYGDCQRWATSNQAVQQLQERFLQSGARAYGCVDSIYPYLKACHTVFGTEVIRTEKTADGFVCVTHGVDGFRSYQAKRIVDTRCTPQMSLSKTYNLLIESKETPAFANVTCKSAGENRYVLSCQVPLLCGYQDARTIAKGIVESFSETQRLIIAADTFDYQVKTGYPKTEDGILYLPAKGYDNPVLAFEAGFHMAEEVRQ